MATVIHNRAFNMPITDPDFLAYLEERDRTRAEVALLTAQLRAATELRMPLVYVVLRKEAPVVKIGTSSVLHSTPAGGGRFSGVMGNVRLVAVTPGSYEQEHAIHQRLAASRCRMDELPGTGATEHFEITDDVVAWINEARTAIGLDVVTVEELFTYSR